METMKDAQTPSFRLGVAIEIIRGLMRADKSPAMREIVEESARAFLEREEAITRAILYPEPQA